MGAVPTPVRASIRDLLADLVGKQVRVDAATMPLALTAEEPAYAATYRFDDGRVAALTVCDLTAAACLGASLGFMSKADADKELEEHGRRLAGDLEEFFREVVNVLAKLLNSPTSPHVALRELDAVPGQVRADSARVALRPGARMDATVTVEGFEAGRLAVLIG